MRINEIVTNLAALVAQDQQERNQYQQFVQTQARGDWNRGAQLYAKLKKRSLDDIFGERQRLTKFTQMKFDFSRFTPQDWQNYWLLAQHSDFDRAFQQQALQNIQQYLGTNSEEYQYLYDRISCGQRGTQKYGTQNICNPD